MKFSIITPSFRNSDWLRLCIASVADQGVGLEHIIQDAGSDDGTLDWLPGDTRVRPFVEPDSGMYDAVNRGLARATGDILAYLNCDEQYLPGALDRVGAFFSEHPGIEVLFADVIVVDPTGRYLCHRMSLVPQKWHSLISGNLSILTCATFFRWSVIGERRLFFDSSLRTMGDAEWVSRLVDTGVRMATLGEFTSIFTDRGSNLGLGGDARRDLDRLQKAAPWWARVLRPAFVAWHRLRRAMKGHYRGLDPFPYEIYSPVSPDRRVRFVAEKPTYRWKRP